MMLSPDFGLAGAVVNQMAISTMEGKRDEAIRLYRTSWLVLTAMGAIFALVGAAAATRVNWKPLGVTLLSNHAVGILSWSLVQIFLGQQLLLLAGVYRSARQNPRCGLLSSFGYALNLSVGIAILVLRGDPLAFVTANVISRSVFLGIMLVDARGIMPDFTLGLRGVSLHSIRPYIVPGLGHAAMPLINALQNEGMVLVLGAILGPTSVAIFQTTRTALNGAKSLTGLAASAVMLEIPALVGEGRTSTVRHLLAINTQVQIAIVLAWSAFLSLLGRQIFHLWLRSNTIYSAPLVLILLASLFPLAIADSFRILLLATNRIHRAVLMLLPAALVSLVVTALGGYFLNLNGAALGIFVFETLSLLVVCTVTAKCTPGLVRATLTDTFSKHSIASAYNSALLAFRWERT
jgi:O-antigen/teichoic acid export membrane protein